MEPNGSTDGPLSPEQKEALREANERLRKPILGSATVATFNAWTLAVFGGLSALAGLFSPATLLVGIALLGIAWNEFRGRRLVRELNPLGPRILGWNQIILAGAVFVYCAWSSWRAWARPEPVLAQLEAALGMAPGEVARLTVTVYAVVFVVTALILGLMARYHFARGPRLDAYLEETPEWIVDIQRSTGVGR